MACICASQPSLSDSVTLHNKAGALLAVYHKACADHGVQVLYDVPMRSVVKEAWIGPAQVPLFRGKEQVRIVERSRDGKLAKVTWVEWVHLEPGKDDMDGQSQGVGAAGGNALVPYGCG